MFNMKGNLQLKQAMYLGAFGGIFGTFGLVAFVIVALGLTQYISKISSLDQNTSVLLNISVTIILAFLTAIYVFLTYQIVAQSAADRKVRFIERKFEKLYYPLRTALKRFDVNYVSDNIGQIVTTTKKGEGGSGFPHYNIINRLWYFKKDIDQVSPYLYMASNELENPFMKIIHLAESNKLFVEEWENLDDNAKVLKAISIMNDDTVAELGSKVNFIVEWHTQSLEIIARDIDAHQKELAMLVK